MAIVRNFFAAIGCLTVLLVLLVAGWLYREEIEEWLRSRNEIVMTEPSERLAAQAEEKLEDVVEGTGSDVIRLSETELQSYVQYRLMDRLPAGVHAPAVDLRDSTVAMSADLRLNELSGDGLDAVRRIIGDSARVVTELYPVVAGPGEARVTVISLQAGLVPVPAMFIPAVLKETLPQFGLSSNGSNRVPVPIPEDVQEIRIGNEEVVIVRSDG
jgi:hypothetical protein